LPRWRQMNTSRGLITAAENCRSPCRPRCLNRDVPSLKFPQASFLVPRPTGKVFYLLAEFRGAICFCAARITGVSNPSSIATAIPRSTSAYGQPRRVDEAFARETLTAACNRRFQNKIVHCDFRGVPRLRRRFQFFRASTSGAALISIV